MDPTEIFLSAPPGLEPLLLDEVRALGFEAPCCVPGGVTVRGGWPEVWRANLCLRGAARVIVQIGAFRAMHMAQLDKRARKFPWAEVIAPGTPVRVEVTCRKSRIYHDRAARQRIHDALAASGCIVQAAPDRDPDRDDNRDPDRDGDTAGFVRVIVRIEDDLVRIGLDTSGAPLHRRGHKQAVGKAPMRETLASLFLRACGYDGHEPVVDPMCGSGTFVLEAAEIAAGLWPGRSRRFAFEDLVGFDAARWDEMRSQTIRAPSVAPVFYGSDRDDGAIRGARANALRAGLDTLCRFERHAVSDLQRPYGAPGLVIVNPPYGARIGNRKLLFALYGALGGVLTERFGGWRVGLVTSDPGLAKAAALPFQPQPIAVSHGGLTVRLYRTGRL